MVCLCLTHFDHLYILLIIDPAGFAHVQVARCEQSKQHYINKLGLSIYHGKRPQIIDPARYAQVQKQEPWKWLQVVETRCMGLMHCPSCYCPLSIGANNQAAKSRCQSHEEPL